MKRVAALLLVLAVCPVAVSSAATAPRAELRAFVCRTGSAPHGRAISITAVMRPWPGTARMELKFELLERVSGAASPTLISGGDLGRWLHPRDPTLGSRTGDVWILRHPVKGLAGPARYRFRVSFRWLGARGRVLATADRSSKTCYEP